MLWKSKKVSKIPVVREALEYESEIDLLKDLLEEQKKTIKSLEERILDLELYIEFGQEPKYDN